MEKTLKGMIVVGLLVVLANVAMAECKPPTGIYPTIDAWRLAGCRNEAERYRDYYYDGGYSYGGYGYNDPQAQGSVSVWRDSQRGGMTIILQIPIPRRHHRR